ncbi:MAG: hypothetical protein LQ346_008964 [Caloplaca aetnensis]|nr:MAG: hypothetical protein LQ346_008964 [Caloplaca aetnensis]
MAVKNQRKDVVARLLPQTNVKGDGLGDISIEDAPSVARSLAYLCLQSPQQIGKDEEEHDIDREDVFPLLAWALQCEHISLVELLAEEVAIMQEDEVEPGQGYKMTALGLASLYGHEAVVRTLLAKGVDPHEEDDHGRAALYYASAEGSKEIVRMLLVHYTGGEIGRRSVISSSLRTAVDEGYESIIRILLHHGADVNTSDDSSLMTPVMKAASNCDEATVRLLLEEGANPLVTDEKGRDLRFWVLGRFRPDINCFASKDLVDTVFERVCRIMHPSGPCPPLTRWRRAQLSLYTEVEFAQFWLYSHYAYLELPLGPPLRGPPLYNRRFTLEDSDNTDLPITYNFSIVHQEATLELAIAIVSFGSVNAKVQVVGGGTRSLHAGSCFKSWSGVELDPNAEFVDQ